MLKQKAPSKASYAPLNKDVEMADLSPSEQVKAPEVKKKDSLSLYELFQILTPYFWPEKGSDGAFINRLRTSSTWLMVILSKGCNLYAPFFIADAANYLVAGQLVAATQQMVFYCILRTLSSFFREMQSILYIKVKQQASIQLQELTFTHLHTLSLNWHLSKKTGSVMKSMDRGVDAASSLVTYLFLFLIPAMAECLAVAILFFIHYSQWQLGVLVVIGVAMYTVVTVGITQWRKKFREATNKHDNDFHDRATDSIINYETVKYFTGEAFEVERFKTSVVQFQVHSSSTQFSLNVLNVSQQVILNATMLGTMIVAGRAVVHGHMTLGGWVAVQSWVVSLFAPLNFLGSVYAAIYQALIDIRNLSELLFESPDIVDMEGAVDIPIRSAVSTSNIRSTSSASASSSASYDAHMASIGSVSDDNYSNLEDGYGGIHGTRSITSDNGSSPSASVEFRGVYFHYPEQPPEKGLKDVSFRVAAGTTTAVVGHTGAGKTTISRLLFRFYDPLQGSVRLNGLNIAQYTQKSVRQAIGIVPQDTVLFNDTILHNVSYGRLGASFAEVEAAAEAAQIRKFIESLPEKWNTMVGERGLKLSGGEKQRVAIARCLLKNPPIVLLDEATSALDTITENSIQEALVALGRNRTVLVIAHRLSTVKHADQIVVMDAGRVAEVGSHAQLLADPNSIYAHMWAMQTSASGGGGAGRSWSSSASGSPVPMPSSPQRLGSHSHSENGAVFSPLAATPAASSPGKAAAVNGSSADTTKNSAAHGASHK